MTVRIPEVFLDVRAKVRRQVRPYLAEGEEVQAVIGIAAPRVIRAFLFATDQRFLLIGNAFWVVRLTDELGQYERQVRLGPARGRKYTLPLPGEGLVVPRRFFRDIRRADAALAEPDNGGLAPRRLKPG